MGGVEVNLHTFLTSALNGAGGSEPDCSALGDSLQYPLDKRLGQPISQSGHGGKEKVPAHARNPTLVIQPIAIHFNDGRLKCPLSGSLGLLQGLAFFLFLFLVSQ
jgi:hypothetical protein